jgi:putative hemolysin
MEPGHLSLLLILPPLLVLSAFFSSSETALFSLTHGDRVRLTHLSRTASGAVSRLLEHPRALLITILVANNVVNVSYLVSSSVLATKASAGVGVAISAGSLLALILLGEILPKLFARKKRVEFCRVVGRPMLLLHRAITPLRTVLDLGVILPLSRLVRPPGGGGESRTVSQEELSALLDISAQRGEIDTEEQRLLAEVVELNAIRVRDAMLPRQDLPWVEHNAGPAELLAAIERSGRMLVPVLRGSLDGQVLGMVDARRFLGAREQGLRPPRTPQITDFLIPALFVPAQARLDQCLEQFRRQRAHEALCVDEYGALVGMIRIEDVLRELVAMPGGSDADGGPGMTEPGVEQAGPGRWLVPGRLGLRALAEFLATPTVAPMSQRVSTVAGAVIVTLGRVPTVGDVVQMGNVRLEVTSMQGRSVERVLVSLVGHSAAAETASGGAGEAAGGGSA